MKRCVFSLSFLLCLTLACKEEPIPIPPSSQSSKAGVVAVFKTNAEGSFKLIQEPDSLKWVTTEGDGIQIDLNVEQKYQEMEGFGAALTESSAYVLMTHLSQSERTNVLKDLFTTENRGIGISFVRITMGASDFSLSDYTYNDLPAGQTDTSMQSFSLGQDLQYLVPLLKEILLVAPDLKIMATPWTAPAWMKSNVSLTGGGKLKPSFYQAYASYFVRYLSEMNKQGIPISSITIQNEPLHEAAYPSLSMSASEQLEFIKSHLGPAMEVANLSTQIIIYDHNWDRTDYPLEILDDPQARKYVAGSAFHCYGGEVGAMSMVNQAYPDKGIYFTECSGGLWSQNFGNNLAWNTENLFVGAPRNWSKTVLLWNMALDENNGPQNGGCADCRGVITVNSNTAVLTKNVEYYLLGHTAKFIRPGACRVETPSTRNLGVSQVAFQNQDGSMALIAYNHLQNSISLSVNVDENKAFSYNLAAGSLVTFSWKPEG